MFVFVTFSVQIFRKYKEEEQGSHKQNKYSVYLIKNYIKFENLSHLKARNSLYSFKVSTLSPA